VYAALLCRTTFAALAAAVAECHALFGAGATLLPSDSHTSNKSLYTAAPASSMPIARRAARTLALQQLVIKGRRVCV
jgi:hypothetical protein